MPRILPLSVVALACAACTTTTAQVERAPDPIVPAPMVERTRVRPAPIPITAAFLRAVQRGTRTLTGVPGPRYWQQWAVYTLSATLDSTMRHLTGTGTVRYDNRSPDTLRTVAVYLRQNVYRPGALRNYPGSVTPGITLSRVAVRGRDLSAVSEDSDDSGYWIDGTVAWIRLPEPLLPGAGVDLAFAWQFDLAGEDGLRDGSDGEVAMVAYWYPQLVVYDDVNGWVTDPYLGVGEFYMGYGDYDVRLTVPRTFIVGATGTLVDDADVLTPAMRARLAEARRTGAVVHVVGDAAPSAAPGGTRTWHFRAGNVRDFSWAASPHYVWDATIALVGDRDGDGRGDTAIVNTYYRASRRAWAWDSSAHYGRFSIEYLSRLLWPYPYPQMTTIDGITGCGGMEYPMMTCIGDARDTLDLFSTTIHEYAHMWFPMAVGSDEQRYAWMDEGLTRYNQSVGMAEYYPGYDRFAAARRSYGRTVAAGEELELMRWSDAYPVNTSAYGVASYDKMSLNVRMLRALLGDSLFLRAYHEYGRTWSGKHPTPYDFFSTFERLSGRDLDWFWRTWWYETWTLDQAIAGLRTVGDSVEITIEDRGEAPMPVLLAITRANGRTERLTVPVDVWLAGATRHTLRVPGAPAITRVVIDPEQRFPDIDRSNQEWTSPSP